MQAPDNSNPAVHLSGALIEIELVAQLLQAGVRGRRRRSCRRGPQQRAPALRLQVGFICRGAGLLHVTSCGKLPKMDLVLLRSIPQLLKQSILQAVLYTSS